MTVFISSKLINICGNEKYWNLLESPPTPSTYPHWTVWNHKRVEIFSEAAFIFLCACVFTRSCFNFPITGKSFSEQLIIASVNPQYDNRLFIELQVQYEKNISLEHVAYKNCFFVFVLTFKTIFVHIMFWTCIFRGIQYTISRHFVG